MRPAENIKHLMQNLSDKPSVQMDQRVRQDMLQALAESEKTPAWMRLKKRRTVIKSPTAKLAAAAMIAIAIALPLAILNYTTAPAWAIEQTIEAIEGLYEIYCSRGPC